MYMHIIRYGAVVDKPVYKNHTSMLRPCLQAWRLFLYGQLSIHRTIHDVHACVSTCMYLLLCAYHPQYVCVTICIPAMTAEICRTVPRHVGLYQGM
jgi:hypothetical protein